MAEEIRLIMGANSYAVESYVEGSGAWFLTDYDGLGMPPVSHISRRGVYQDGETYERTTVHPRLIDLGFRVHALSRSALWSKRAELIAYLSAFDDLLLGPCAR